MARLSKRMRSLRERLGQLKPCPPSDAIRILKENSAVKFPESLDVAVKLGIDPRKSEQMVRGSTVLPHGTGRSVRVAVFTGGDKAQAALDAGADIVGMDELAEQVRAGKFDFDVVIASPDAMRVVGQLGQILGPRGLMPNPKVGTVAADVAQAVRNAKAGQVRYRADKGGIIHCSIGKIGFDAGALQENLNALIADLIKAKPATAKGVYLKKITLSSTMGPGVAVDQSALTGQ